MVDDEGMIDCTPESSRCARLGFLAEVNFSINQFMLTTDYYKQLGIKVNDADKRPAPCASRTALHWHSRSTTLPILLIVCQDSSRVSSFAFVLALVVVTRSSARLDAFLSLDFFLALTCVASEWSCFNAVTRVTCARHLQQCRH